MRSLLSPRLSRFDTWMYFRMPSVELVMLVVLVGRRHARARLGRLGGIGRIHIIRVLKTDIDFDISTELALREKLVVAGLTTNEVDTSKQDS